MRIEISKIGFTQNRFIAVILFVLLAGSVWSQTTDEAVDNKVHPPEKEDFTNSSDLLQPNINRVCEISPSDPRYLELCDSVTPKDIEANHRLSLYNEDGSLWYRFSIIPKYPDSFIGERTQSDHGKMRKEGFSPFFSDRGFDEARAQLVLPIRRESKNWYEVEVNQNTKETKYAPKFIPTMWQKITLSHWYWSCRRLEFDGAVLKLHDKPNGTRRLATEFIDFTFGHYQRTETDWVLVLTEGLGVRYFGWIRARQDDQILVKCYRFTPEKQDR